MVRAALLVTQGIIALHVAVEKHRRQMWTCRWWPGRESVYRHCQTNLLALVAQARDPARARLEVRRAVLPSGIRLITRITVGARRDPTTTPLIERGPPGFSSAGLPLATFQRTSTCTSGANIRTSRLRVRRICRLPQPKQVKQPRRLSLPP
jgi:hypothetical protein